MNENPDKSGPNQSGDPAQGRFFALQMMRLSGIALVVFGLLIINGKVDLPAIAGYISIAVGMADALLMPAVLARAWKSPIQ